MSDTVLLLGNNREHGMRLARILIQLGLKPTVADWQDFNPRHYLSFRRPKLIIANTDHPKALPFNDFSASVRKRWGQDFPIIALSGSRKFDRVAALLDGGADACLPPNDNDLLMERKITACLENAQGQGQTQEQDLDEEIPESLLTPFLDNKSLVPLGSLVSIHAGVAPRSPRYRRTAPPDENWRKIITSELLEKFHISRPTTYVMWSKLHLFRLPTLAEYSVPEKVVLSRVGPPLVAAVDRTRSPVGADAYSLVPNENVNAGYVACLLNSRLLDFYFNRIARTIDGRIRPDTIKNTPVPPPTPAVNREFERFAALLAHFGPDPKSWIDKQSRNEIQAAMENAVFSLYKVPAGAREDLASLHF